MWGWNEQQEDMVRHRKKPSCSKLLTNGVSEQSGSGSFGGHAGGGRALGEARLLHVPLLKPLLVASKLLKPCTVCGAERGLAVQVDVSVGRSHPRVDGALTRRAPPVCRSRVCLTTSLPFPATCLLAFTDTGGQCTEELVKARVAPF